MKYRVGELVEVVATGKRAKILHAHKHNDCEASYMLEGYGIPFWESQLCRPQK